MKKNLVLTAIISAVIASTLSIVAVFATQLGGSFPDVDENTYYADSVYAMRTLGVINGYENGNFGPDDFVTRGQLATMLDRYNSALLSPPYPAKSGVSDLAEILCFGGLEFNIDNEGIQGAYDKVCDIP